MSGGRSIRGWLADNWATVLFGVLGFVGISGVIFAAGQVLDAFVSYPLPLGIVGVVAFLAGIGFEWVVSRRKTNAIVKERVESVAKAEGERDEAVAKAEHERDEAVAERDELAETVRAQREEIAQGKVQIAKLESELASDRGLSVDEVRKAIADELAKEDYRKLWRPDYGNQKPLTWGTLVGVPDGRPDRPGEHCQREGAPGRAGRRGASEEGEATA